MSDTIGEQVEALARRLHKEHFTGTRTHWSHESERFRNAWRELARAELVGAVGPGAPQRRGTMKPDDSELPEEIWDDPKGIAHGEMVKGLQELRETAPHRAEARPPSGKLRQALGDLAEQSVARLRATDGGNLMADVRSGAHPEGPPAEPPSGLTDATLMAIEAWRSRYDEEPPAVVYDITRAAYNLGQISRSGGPAPSEAAGQAMAPLAADDPRMVAWNEWVRTATFGNARSWPMRGPAYIDGALWAAFLAGWDAAVWTGREEILRLAREHLRVVIQGFGICEADPRIQGWEGFEAALRGRAPGGEAAPDANEISYTPAGDSLYFSLMEMIATAYPETRVQSTLRSRIRFLLDRLRGEPPAEDGASALRIIAPLLPYLRHDAGCQSLDQRADADNCTCGLERAHAEYKAGLRRVPPGRDTPTP